MAGGPLAAPVPVTVDVAMSDNTPAHQGFATVNDAVTTLRTSGFAGCFGIILLAPGNTRTLAHISSWHYPVNYAPWNNIAAFQALAAVAHTAHIYHWPSYWAQGDGADGDAFIAYFGLPVNIVVHGTPPVVQVDPAGNVTP